MTPSQQRTLDALRGDGLSGLFGAYADKYEFKRFEARPNGSELSVVIIVGRIGDEGTMAESFARDKWHLFVSKHGAVTAFNGDKFVRCPRRVLRALPRIPAQGA